LLADNQQTSVNNILYLPLEKLQTDLAADRYLKAFVGNAYASDAATKGHPDLHQIDCPVHADYTVNG
jgi:hypothetical protein